MRLGGSAIKGRKKEMIVTPQGLNVFPEDVERVLLAQPGVREAGVVGVALSGEERIHAVLVLEADGNVESIVRGANAQAGRSPARVEYVDLAGPDLAAHRGHEEAQAPRSAAMGRGRIRGRGGAPSGSGDRGRCRGPILGWPYDWSRHHARGARPEFPRSRRADDGARGGVSDDARRGRTDGSADDSRIGDARLTHCRRARTATR